DKPAGPRFQLEAAIHHANLVRGMLGESLLPLPPRNADAEALAGYFQEPTLREYLEARPYYFDQFSEAQLRQRVILQLVPLGYRHRHWSDD
ncbi:MAG TPA: hypothetical protein VFW62_01155, partial [bacterium]|nr:hypothetical protein [bacterium]